MQLAALLGGWVPRITPAGAKLLLARHARHFAWHAELWDGVVPVLHDRPEGSAVTEPTLQEAAAALAAVTEPKGVYDDVAPPRGRRLPGVVRGGRRRSPSDRSCGSSTSSSTTSTSTPRRATTSSHGAEPAIAVSVLLTGPVS